MREPYVHADLLGYAARPLVFECMSIERACLLLHVQHGMPSVAAFHLVDFTHKHGMADAGCCIHLCPL